MGGGGGGGGGGMCTLSEVIYTSYSGGILCSS